ncbi:MULTISPECIES: YnfA family protein [unclassified Pseudomonas]|uniref:YnfA family protein n=1 Tax=unclassified Pseudomonas TaxID=196821 RepID=UPI000BD1FE24|nr:MULTISPECIES: YnfA family protein [unclassified Pseudomonas]PVZ20055.1 small multidrug resistance family-3 protein [Pseudomonas sp. URIL14HWK12:I12]PVZ27121.1 small multidrug resistance family-3 protein [Pseudomonas sp. URIL14HWK12:I10]PVZ38010.1 small multidrug resistance family-3 protein [Pseudomonas sp. URIL14HWK12:I11]SNZ04827.1 small multidrug resistance family-3 protein [Pseudomonas sp. URIL14HWK12:I9]
MLNYLWFLLAAGFEIAGCYGFYTWLRLGKGLGWAVLGVLSLACFALVLTRVEAAYAGRAYAAYGGIYIASSLAWLALVEKSRPLATDWAGAVLCIVGASVILWGPRFNGG